MVFGVYKEKMIRMIKRSLYGVIVCKKWFNIFIWENVCTTRKTKIIKTRILKDISEFDWSKNGNVFDWHRKHIHGMFFLLISWYCLLPTLMQSLWNRAWQVVQETWCFLYFSTAAFTEDFCYSQCKIQVNIGLIWTKKI